MELLGFEKLNAGRCKERISRSEHRKAGLPRFDRDNPADLIGLLGLEAEIKPRIVLEHERAPDTVRFAPDDDERGHESQCLKVPLEFGRVPHLPMLRFESHSAARLSVYLGDHLTTD